MAKATLYERLGGYNAIAAVIDDLMKRMREDSRLAKYFVGHSEDSIKRLRQLQVDMVCQAAGGPCFYKGRDMRTAHKGLGINGVEWQAAVAHLLGVLQILNIGDEEQKEIYNLLNSIKKDIVEKP